jgi:hypothetical protein
MTDELNVLQNLLAREEIRQLVSAYAFAVDRRDVVALVDLYIPDVDVAEHGSGREALALYFENSLSKFGISFHFVGNHLISFRDATHAEGVVYCRAEHEAADKWVVMDLLYEDQYEYYDQRWMFRQRRVRLLYAVDQLERPHSVKGRYHFPGAPVRTTSIPEAWSTWTDFWARHFPMEPHQ